MIQIFVEIQAADKALLKTMIHAEFRHQMLSQGFFKPYL
jgi:hypothetical protein